MVATFRAVWNRAHTAETFAQDIALRHCGAAEGDDNRMTGDVERDGLGHISPMSK
jgi:hypothetical protein